MTPAQQLINAIQSSQPHRLRAVIETLQRQAGIDLSQVERQLRHTYSDNPVNDRLPGLDITPLHVAAKAYSAYANDPLHAWIFGEMVRDLINAGANPVAVMGRTSRLGRNGYDAVDAEEGLTVAQVCEGKLPPALAAFFAKHCDDNATMKIDAPDKHEHMLKLEEERLAKWRMRKAKRQQAQREEQELEEVA